MTITAPAKAPARSVAMTLAPLLGVVLFAFIVIGMALPVLPLHRLSSTCDSPLISDY